MAAPDSRDVLIATNFESTKGAAENQAACDGRQAPDSDPESGTWGAYT